MSRKQLFVMLLAAATFVSTTALAGEIYRYTDDEGNVHYGDRPTGAESEERLNITSRRTDNAAVQTRAETRYARNDSTPQQDAELAAPEDEEEEELNRAERVAVARQRQQKCQEYRARLETFVTSRRLFREGDDGDRVYLDESETLEAREQAQEMIEEYCD